MGTFEQATKRFLHVGHKEPKPMPRGVTTMTLRVQAPLFGQDGPDLSVQVHCRGSGPAVLVLHGWRSQAADMHSISTILADTGYKVWMPDLPGHGHSEGEYLSIPLAAKVLHAVQAFSGPFTLAVGHSFGGASLVHALAGGLQAQRVAVLAAPTHYGRFARLAAQQAGMLPSMVDQWLTHLGASIGCHPDDIDMKRQARGLKMPAMLAHSREDTVASFTDMQEVASIWPGATWLPLEGLGHFRLLADPDLLSKLQHFARQGHGF